MRRFIRRCLALVYPALSAINWLIFTSGAIVIGALRRRQQIISVWPATGVTLTPKIVIFMHFDRLGNVRSQLLNYINELSKNGRSVIFVTNAGKLSPKALADLQKICISIVIRKNQGYDFGAWRDVIAHFKLPEIGMQELILANDSVFGPLRPLDEMLSKIDYGKADIWGLTDSWQYKYHLQSFFLSFGPTALNSQAFRDFWASIRPVPDKTYIVKEYEIGITQKMAKGGLRCAAIWPYETLLNAVNDLEIDRLLTFKKNDYRKIDPVGITHRLALLRIRDGIAQRTPLNPTAELWRQLLLSGFPFIKRELLRDNPTRVEDVHDWIEVVRSLGADPEPVLYDLRMMLKNRAP